MFHGLPADFAHDQVFGMPGVESLPDRRLPFPDRVPSCWPVIQAGALTYDSHALRRCAEALSHCKERKEEELLVANAY
jgi:hypothetical protein